MRTIQLDFSDFWEGFDKENNFFTNLLRQSFEIKISDTPDFLIYSTPGSKHKAYSCTKIFYTGESEIPDYSECDYSISFEITENERNIRFPLYVLYGEIEQLLAAKKPYDEIQNQHTKFCNMVVSNGNATKRIEFFHELSKYKKVDSGGKFLNNIGGPVANKMEFISKYKFSISFENTSHQGYTTEKIIEPMYAGSMPVYWGNPEIAMDFNTQSFLNWHEFGSDKALIDRIIELDQNESLYEEVYNQPYLLQNKLTPYSDKARLLKFLEAIFNSPIQNKRFYYGRNLTSRIREARMTLSKIKNRFTGRSQ